MGTPATFDPNSAGPGLSVDPSATVSLTEAMNRNRMKPYTHPPTTYSTKPNTRSRRAFVFSVASSSRNAVRRSCTNWLYSLY